ncbi:autophagy-related protein 13-domain-containing protein [Aspergillus californicus]
MHQHPRSPAPATLPTSARPRSQDQDRHSDSPGFDLRTHLNRGLGIESENESADSAHNTQPGKEAIAKLSQIISNYHTKAALIVLHSRVELPPSFPKGSDTPRVNRWFNVEIEETDVLREQLKTWRLCDVTDNRPPPMIIETFLDTKGLTNNQTLVALDENGKRWDVLESLAASQSGQPVNLPSSSRADDVILERWRVELGDMPGKLPSDLGPNLPTVYKKSIVLFRSLFTYAKFLPAWKFIKRNGRFRANPALRIKYRILSEKSAQDLSKPDHLTIPLYEGNTKVVDTYSFGVTESPAGPFTVEVTYRTSCDFRVDDSEALLSSQFMGADDEIFQPSLPSRGMYTKSPNMEIGSAPLERKTVQGPDPSQAYGSLSTFHHVAPTGASPIATLRAVRDSGASSPSPPTSHRKPSSPARASPAGRAAVLASEGSPNVVRRPSISFQPFKAPPLSASPSLVDPPLGVSPRTAAPTRSSLSESRNMPPPSTAISARKPLSSTPDNAIASSISASPRPASISRYSSAFSHRRGRPSSGNINRVEDDNSSGRASATSSGAQPGSGLLAELTGTSADSIHADDENISEFLKMLDLRKDLLKPSSHTASDSLARRTTTTSAALSRFQRMRDSNAALSDSMTSSMLHRSSNASSKQLSGVPPMIAGTSVSTASSPGGKAISPHTPHTPAIPSRLSSNSIVDHDAGTTTRPLSHRNNRPRLEDDTSDEITVQGHPSTVTAIPIPTSPASLFPSTFRRSSSAANRRSSAAIDDDEIFNMRSISLGADEPSHSSLRQLQRQHEYEIAETNIAPAGPELHSGESHDPTLLRGTTTQEPGAHRGGSTMGTTAGSSPFSNQSLNQRRFSHSRSRGFSGGTHALGSGSSSVARGNPPQSSQVEEDEPLLFAMSDFVVSRRSLEEGRQAHGADTGTSTGGSRRGSGRRSGLSSFHPWP